MPQENLSVNLGTESEAPAAAELKPAEQAAPVRRRSGGSPFLTRTNLGLLVMFAAGILGMYALRLRQGPAAAMAGQNPEHAKVEAALNTLGAGGAGAAADGKGSAKAIVAEFYAAARQRQVDAKELLGDPFVPRNVEEAPPPAPVEVKKPEVKKPDEYEHALLAVKGLRLQSVLVGKQTTAMISSNLVTVGQTIKGWTVVRIDTREVELGWKDKTYVLEMPKQVSSGG
jgi:hypothetical protein